MSKRIFTTVLTFIFIFSFTIATPAVHAQVNAGFIEASIWFSNEPDVVGESTTISTLINNQDEKAVYGMVGFYDNDTLISKKAATIDAHGSKVVSVPWKVTAGSHSIVAKFEDTKRVSDKGTATRVTSSQSAPYRFSVAATTAKTAETKTNTSSNSSTVNESKTEQAVGDVKNAAENTFESFDGFRDDTATSLAEKVSTSEKEIATIKAGKVAGTSTSNAKDATVQPKESALKTPFAYLKLYFFKIAHFIFSQMYVFYGLIILIIILFVRYLIRAPR